MKPYLKLPQDPVPNCNGNPFYRKYIYMSDGKDFKLEFLYPEEPASLKTYADPFYDGGPINVGVNDPNPGSCSGSGDGTNVTAWAIYSRGAECWHH